MEENELLQHFTNIVQELTARLDETNAKLDSITSEYQKAKDEFDDNERGRAWEEKFGDKLHQYDHDLKAINGDDFDIITESRKEYEDGYTDYSDDEYVEALTKNIEEAVGNLKAALAEGEPEEVAKAAEEVKETVEEAETETNPETATAPAETKEEANAEATSDEAEKEDVVEKAEEQADENDTEESDEVEDFIADLEAEKEKMDAQKKSKDDKEEE